MTNEDRLAALEERRKHVTWTDGQCGVAIALADDALTLCHDYQKDVERLRAINTDLVRVTQSAIANTKEVEASLNLREVDQSEVERLRVDRDEWKQQHENLLAVRQQDLAAFEAKTKHFPLAVEIADLIYRMQRGDYSKGTALDLTARWLRMCKRDSEQGPR